MLELEYIPLKTPDGAICGHARVRGGFVELSLRTTMPASALVITENGSADGAVNARIPVSAQVSAIALHEKDVMRCCGFSRTTALKPSDLRRRLQAMAPAKARKVDAVIPPKPLMKSPIKPLPEQQAPSAFVEEIAAGIPDFTPPSKPVEAPTVKAPPDIASRDALHARAARVYKRINEAGSAMAYVPTSAPQPPPDLTAPTAGKPESNASWPPPPAPKEPTPAPKVPEPPPAPTPKAPVPPPAPAEPIPAPSQPEPPPVKTAPSSEPERRAVNRAHDTATHRTVPSAPVPNPFPHIFPDAQFIRVGANDALLGEWIHGTSRAEISAVPGPYSPQPPPHLAGYTRYIRARSGGYWVKVIEH